MNPAPIGVSTYARVEHLRQTIAALQRNTLAAESELYIFSDAPKPGDEAKVREVRSFIKMIDGFKRVEIIERETNSRTYNNRQGMRMLLDRYGRMIFMEEDIVTAPTFIEYMNYMLDTYEDNPMVFSIAGYCPPIQIPKDYPYGIFLHPRFNPWGFGTWKDRFDKLEMQIPQRIFREIFFNPKTLWQFSQGGLDILPPVLNNYFHYADGLDSRIFAQQFSMNMLTVYPTRHLVDNSGVDGSGVHKKKKHWYRVTLSTDPFKEPALPGQMTPDPEIMRAFYVFRSGGIFNRIKILLLCVTIITKHFLMRYRREN